jgi:hypothetical protein
MMRGIVDEVGTRIREYLVSEELAKCEVVV